MAITPGYHLDQYEVLGALGAGGMGEVYRARDARLDRDVAIKALPAAVAADPDRLARFRREARVVAQLNHPHIAQIHQLLEHASGTYLVLEYVPGKTLAETLQAREGLEIEEALRLCTQVARAIEAAHGRGVVHRDLKPGNVMVTPDGTAKVLDFGLAVQAAAPGSGATATRTRSTAGGGGVQGTPGYMAPEQVRGEEVDGRADLWAFGCVLYECLAGVPAIRGRSHAELHAATLTADPELGRLPGSLAEPVRAILRRCLTRDLGRRQQSIADVRIVLQEALGVAPVTPDVPEVVAAQSPHNLPRDTSHFIGRETQLEALAHLLDDNVLVTLTGAGGSGKTRLSTELGRRLLARFDGGVWLAELAPVSDAALVSPAVAAAFGVREDPKRPLAETIASHLQERKALLILDNCEHLLETTSDLAQALLRGVPGLRIVATSREALGVAGERSYRVPSLTLPEATARAAGARSPASSSRGTPVPRTPSSTPASGGRATPGSRGTPATPESAPVDLAALLASEAVTLFVDRARGVRPAFELNESNAAAVAGICVKLDGIPLAIELAAARVKILSPEQILAKLDDRFRLLTSGGRGVMERQRTLRAAVDWSYKLLTVSERRMLRALSVFAGGWTLESAIAVCGPGGGEEGEDLDEFEVLDLLTHLIDKSLVLVDDAGEAPRYRLLETVRQYASEELDREDETMAVRDRHLDHFHDLVCEASAGDDSYWSIPEDWKRRMLPDAENLLEAMAWARVAPAAESEGKSRISEGLLIGERLQGFWTGNGLHRPALLALEGLLERRDEADPERVAHGFYVAGNLTSQLGDLEQGRAHMERGLEIGRALDSKETIRRCLNGVGTSHLWRGEVEKARACFEESLALAREIGEAGRIGAALQNLATATQDDAEKARALTEEALGFYRSADNLIGMAQCTYNLGGIHKMAREFEKARTLLADSVGLFQRMGDRTHFAAASGSLGECLVRVGELDEARARLTEAIALAVVDRVPVTLLNVIDSIALLIAATGEPERAIRYLSAEEALASAIGIEATPAEALRNQEDVAAARAALREATGSDEAADRAEAEGKAMTLEALSADAAAWLKLLEAKAGAADA